MNTAYIIAGSNLGNRLLHLNNAASAISQKIGTVVKKSAIYQTAAWGTTTHPDYLNQVLCINTLLTPSLLLHHLLAIEQKMGRIRNLPNDPRTLDLDILLYDNLILDTPALQLPHPRLHQRRFVLEPLNEIAPDLVHPKLKIAIAALLLQCNDSLNVKKFSL